MKSSLGFSLLFFSFLFSQNEIGDVDIIEEPKQKVLAAVEAPDLGEDFGG